MKKFRDSLLTAVVMALALMANGAPQRVTGSYYWLTGAATTSTASTGIIDPDSATVVSGSSATFTANPPLGQKAIAWYKASGTPLTSTSSFERLGTGNTYTWTNVDGSTANVILGLELDYISYKLKYDGGGEATYRYTDSVTIADCTSTRVGYDFAGAWTNSVGKTFVKGNTVTGSSFEIANRDDSAVVTLYPKWAANVTQLTLDPDGGTGGSSSVSATYDANLPDVTPPTRTGYTFKGYWTAKNGAEKQYYDASGKGVTQWAETSANTLYAAWQVNYYAITVSKTGAGSVSLSPTGGNYAYGQSVTMTATPDNEGAYFVKWSDGNTENPRTVTVTKTATYTAEFGTHSYTVRWLDASTFDSKVLKTETIDWGKNATAPDQPAHDGYTFLSWTSDGRDVRQNRDISAQYQANTYTVRLNPNGGQGSAKDINYTYGTSGNLPANQFKRTGYQFVGWGTNESEVVYEDGAQVLNWATQGTVELYAIWEAHAFTVVYETKAGEGTMETQAFHYDEPQNLTSNKFVNGELGFLRWSCSNGKSYLDGELVSNLTDVANGVVTNTAVWATTYFVEFDGNGATSGTMQLQKFSGPDDEQALAANDFAKTGYSFKGWAKSQEDAAQHRNLLADHALVKGLSSEAGATVTLYAAWEAITYYVAFATDASGVQLSEPPVLTLHYDEETVLPEYSTYFGPKQSDLDTFKAWRDDMNGVTYANGAMVSNLCTTAQATNVLVATWKLDVGEWSEHMHCTTLRWGVRAGSPDWEMKEGEEWGVASGMSVAQEGGGVHPGQGWLTAQVKTNGTLSFSCRWKKSVRSEEPNSWLAIGFADGDGEFNDDNKYKTTTVILDTTGWRRVDIPVQLADGFSQLNIHLGIYIGVLGDFIEIDQMVWIPEGTDPGGDEPQPGKDEPTVTGIAFENGKVVIRSTGDAKFGYQVLSTFSLSPANWQPEDKSYQAGQTDGQKFELTIDPAEPQKFYKVEVLKKR